tara:strand:- start:19 stop:405 length:387 start_codon:yes stop_codon:yes gene_type:complete
MDISNVITNNQNKIIDASLNEIAKQQYLQKKQEYYDRVKIESVNMICRQTDYSEDEAKERLEKYNYNYQLVLNDFFNIKENPKENKTTNQSIYGEIRNLMDTGARKFREQQERSKQYEEYMKNKKQIK